MQIPAPGAHQCVIGVAIALPSHYAAQVREVREAAGDPLAEVDSAVVVICDNGLRSSIAAAELREKGILAESVAGGLIAWGRDGNPIIPGPYRRR